MKDKIKKISLGGVLAIFCFISLFGSLLAARPAYAGGMMVMNPSFDVFITNGLKKQIKEPIAEKIKVGVMMAVMRLLTYFVQKVSYDLAVYAASGGKGQGALAHAKSFSSYMKNVGDHAVGGAIEELGKAVGLNLCKPPDLSLELTLRLGLKQKYCDPETGKGGDQGVCTPACTLSQFKKNWSAVGGSKYWEKQADNFNFALQPSQSDFGFYLESSAKVDNISAKATEGAKYQRTEDQGAKGLTSLIAGDIKTPGAVMMDQYKEQAPAKQGKEAQRNAGSAIASGVDQIPQFAASVFLNTFLSTALKNFMDKGMLFGKCVTPSKCDKGDVGINESSSAISYDSYSMPGRAEAEAYYSYLLKISYSTIDDFDLLTQFETCDSDNRGLHNCVLDSALAEAVRRADLGEAITIGDLVTQNKTIGERKIYGPTHSLNNDYKCYQSGFCYYNIKKLRQARILPLGFEIAATLSPKDQPITLNDVLNNFNNEASSYYHLVDPNWLLKMPKARCDLYSYGSSLSGSDSNSRAQECADLKSCVSVNSKGECNTYGYCVREGNIWKFDLTACTPQYRTCKAFTESTTGGKSAYLYRSLDTENCTTNNSSCQAYTLSRDYGSGGLYISGLASDNSWTTQKGVVKYFKTSSAESCTADAAGCSGFKVFDSTSTNFVYLKKAPAYLLESRKYDINSADIDCNHHISLHYDSNNGQFSGATLSDSRYCAQDILSYNNKPLDCYRKSNGEFPATKAELSAFEQELKNIGAYDECNKYAKICLPEEENCNMYSPTSYSGLDVPAKFNPAVVNNNQVTWNDQCDKSCVGYAAYQELDSNYANGHDIEYIIPSSGSTCTNVGCSSFTNMSTTAGDVENVEYFSYLRPCIKPDAQKQKQFVTYEGSESSGYRLATYQLVEEKTTGDYADNSKSGTGGETGPLGGPKYFYRTPQDLVKYNNVCNEKVYWGGASGNYSGTSYYWDKDLSSDCRQFNDNQGKIYYRLLSKTIVASDKCTPYRLNSTELYNDSLVGKSACTGSVGHWDETNNVCQVCFQNGEYRDGFCYYDGLPANASDNAGNSSSCTKAEDTCRSFKGNTGNNIEEIFFDKIESNTTLTWQPSNKIFAVNDSVQTNGYSLKFNNDNGSDLTKNVSLETGQTYELSFWSRGTVGATSVKLTVNGQSIPLISIGVGDTWKQYKSNAFKVPASVTGEAIAINAVISFTTQNNGSLFLDNIRLVKIQDVFNLVKSSLSVPALCDSNLYDGLPGEALGCSAYNYNSIGNTNAIYLTNFSYLCREEAVGCTKFTDTNNLSSDQPSAFNVWLEGEASSTLSSITLGSDVYSCFVPKGNNGCYINTKGSATTNKIAGYKKDKIYNPDSKVNVKEVMFKPDSVYISGFSAKPIYLVANSNAVCAAANVGCVESAAIANNPNSSKPTYTTSYLKLNDPENYSDNLCKAQENGCKSYTDADGGNYYFKDPKVLGQRVCSFKKDVVYMRDGWSTKVTGWFWDNVGKCATGTAITNFSLLEKSSSYCLSDNDCSGNYKCVNTGNWPCYGESASFSTEDGGYFGLWSFGATDFDGFAGSCPTEQHGCTKFVDHNDSQIVNVDGVTQNQPKAYYYLADDKYSARAGDSSCGGEVSVKKGCVLLDKTDEPTKKYNTAASYTASKNNNSELTPPVSNNSNDANVVVKATQDRECSEWLYCGSYTLDAKGNRSCTSLRACNKSGAGDEDCASDGDITGIQDVTGRKLVNYSDADYVTNLGGDIRDFQKIYKPTGGRMAGMINYRYRDTSWAGREFSGYSMYSAVDSLLSPPGGIDLRGYQIFDIDKMLNSKQNDVVKTAKKITACRVYPAADSPFFRDNILEKNDSGFVKKDPFANANIFQEVLDYSLDDALASDCEYKKITYGNGSVTRYYKGNEVAEGVCYGSTLEIDDNTNKCSDAQGCCDRLSLDAAKCEAAIQNGLQCLSKDTKITQASGQKGYCLERDYRKINNSDTDRACMTWLPISNTKDSNWSSSDLGLMKESTPNVASEADRYMCIYNNPLVMSTVPVNQYGTFEYGSSDQNYLSEPFAEPMPDFRVLYRVGKEDVFYFNTILGSDKDHREYIDWAPFPEKYSFNNKLGGDVASDNPLTFFEGFRGGYRGTSNYDQTTFNNKFLPSGAYSVFSPQTSATIGGDNIIFQPVQVCPLGYGYDYYYRGLDLASESNRKEFYKHIPSCIPLKEVREKINKYITDNLTAISMFKIDPDDLRQELLTANQIVRIDYNNIERYYVQGLEEGADHQVVFEPYRYQFDRDSFLLSNPVIYKSDIKRIDVYYDNSNVKPGVIFFDMPALYNDQTYKNLYNNGENMVTENTYRDANDESHHYYYAFRKKEVNSGPAEGFSWVGFVSDSFTEGTKEFDATTAFNTLFDNNQDSGFLGEHIANCGNALTSDGEINENNCECATAKASDDNPPICERTWDGGTQPLNNGLGARVWFNKNNQFVGVEFGVGDKGNNDSVVSFFFVIHLNNGRCAKIAKVWDGKNGGKPYYYNMELTREQLGEYQSYPLRNDISPTLYSGYRSKNLEPHRHGLVRENILKPLIDVNGSTTTNLTVDDPNGNNILTIDPFNFGQVTEKLLESFGNGGTSDYYYNFIYNGSYDAFYDKQTEPSYSLAYNAGVPLSIFHGVQNLSDHASAVYDSAINNNLLGSMFAKIYGVYKMDDNNSNYYLENGSSAKKYAPKDHTDHIAPQFAAPKCFTGSSNTCAENVVNTMATNTFSLLAYNGIMGATNTYAGSRVVISSGETQRTYSNDYGDVLMDKSGGRVTFNYYLWTDKNHLPIKKVSIDSDNRPSTQAIEMSGEFPMHVPNCNVGCLNGNCFYKFIDDNGKAVLPNRGESCIDNTPPPSFTDRYSCDFYSYMFSSTANYNSENLKISDVDSKYYYKGAGSSSTYHFAGIKIIDNDATAKPAYNIINNTIQIRSWEAEKLGLVNGDAVCVFMPRIQAIDNWNWCNKAQSGITFSGVPTVSCSNSSVSACFGITGEDQSPECTLNNANAWTYGGRVIIKPNVISTGADGTGKNTWDYMEDFVGSE